MNSIKDYVNANKWPIILPIIIIAVVSLGILSKQGSRTNVAGFGNGKSGPYLKNSTRLVDGYDWNLINRLDITQFDKTQLKATAASTCPLLPLKNLAPKART